MGINALPSERNPIIVAQPPFSIAAGATTATAGVDCRYWGRLMALILCGDIGAGGTITAAVQESTSSGGTFATISGKTITGLTVTTNDTNSQALINVRSDEFSAGNRYARLLITATGGTAIVGGCIFGADPRHGPGNEFDAATVAEIVN